MVVHMAQSYNSKLNILTWNMRSLNDYRKLRKVLLYLTRHNIDKALLQKSHLPPNSPVLRSRGLQGNAHTAGFTSHARGVITWVNPKSQLKLEPLDTDPEGRFVISRCRGKGIDLTLVNIYGPNFDNPIFYTTLLAPRTLTYTTGQRNAPMPITGYTVPMTLLTYRLRKL